MQNPEHEQRKWSRPQVVMIIVLTVMVVVTLYISHRRMQQLRSDYPSLGSTKEKFRPHDSRKGIIPPFIAGACDGKPLHPPTVDKHHKYEDIILLKNT